MILKPDGFFDTALPLSKRGLSSAPAEMPLILSLGHSPRQDEHAIRR